MTTSAGAGTPALVSAAIAPVYAQPELPAALISQLVLGARVDVLEHRDSWATVRSEDGYLGWVHEGYLRTGAAAWARAWERAEGGEPVISLGAELVDREGRLLMRLPWGARVLRRSGAYHLPDGRAGNIAGGEIVEADRLADRFPPRGESIVRTARRWLGSPYLWGGVTPAGVDCSGLTQAVMWMHGIALPRDSDLQAGVGVLLEGGDYPDRAHAGDLLFFAEAGDRVSHVAISAGDGTIIHSSLSNGGVASNRLAGDLELERRLRRLYVFTRRLLPD